MKRKAYDKEPDQASNVTRRALTPAKAGCTLANDDTRIIQYRSIIASGTQEELLTVVLRLCSNDAAKLELSANAIQTIRKARSTSTLRVIIDPADFDYDSELIRYMQTTASTARAGDDPEKASAHPSTFSAPIPSEDPRDANNCFSAETAQGSTALIPGLTLLQSYSPTNSGQDFDAGSVIGGCDDSKEIGQTVPRQISGGAKTERSLRLGGLGMSLSHPKTPAQDSPIDIPTAPESSNETSEHLPNSRCGNCGQKYGSRDRSSTPVNGECRYHSGELDIDSDDLDPQEQKHLRKGGKRAYAVKRENLDQCTWSCCHEKVDFTVGCWGGYHEWDAELSECAMLEKDGYGYDWTMHAYAFDDVYGFGYREAYGVESLRY